MVQRRAHRPSSVIERRLEAIRTKIQQKSLDGYLINHRVDQYYSTGFDGEDGAVLILPKSVILLTDGRFTEAAASEAPWAKAVIRKKSLVEATARAIKRHRLIRLGFNPATMTLQTYRDLSKAIRPTRLVPLPTLVQELRNLKDAGEIAAIEKAAEIAESAFLTVARRLKTGMTERQIAADLQWEMVRRGASDVAFPLIVAEGANASLPHAVTRRPVDPARQPPAHRLGRDLARLPERLDPHPVHSIRSCLAFGACMSMCWRPRRRA